MSIINFVKKKLNNLISDKKFEEILHGGALSLSAKVLGVTIGIFSNIIVARYYGPEIMGIVAILNSFFAIAVLFSLMGMNVSLLRLIPEYIAKFSYFSAYNVYKKILKTAVFLSLIVAALLFFSSDFIASNIFNKSHLSILFAVAAIFLIGKTLVQINTNTIRALKNIKLYAFAQILPNLVNFFFLALLTSLFYQKYNPIYIQFLIIIVGTLATAYMVKKLFCSKIENGKPAEKISYHKIFSISSPMFLTATMHLVISQTDIVMLGIMKSEADVGVYSVAVKLALLTSAILIAFNTIIAPKFSELYHSEKIDELAHVAKKSAKLIFWITAPILIVLMAFGKGILSVFGDKFVVAYWALFFLIIGQFVNSAAGSVGYLLNMTGHQIAFRNIVFAAGILNIMLNYFLIPVYGIYGAAIASMICISLWNIAASIYVKIKFGFRIAYVPFC
ncbi:MAG: flippase [Candidatus Aureabacteria bacterium]|nr:flippase [Candidatus Auribacterota bacterium]